tara:strand:- start:12 stop:407 length:396 start_codon:yes stop_codon:yes gene_type:complete
MKTFYKFLVGFIIIGLLSLIGFGVMIGSMFSSDNMCDNTIIATKFSPNQNNKIVLFERSCGATTGFSTQVSILEKENDLENENSAILITEKDSLNIKWINDDEVSIEIKKNSEVFKKQNHFNGIKINYKEY